MMRRILFLLVLICIGVGVVHAQFRLTGTITDAKTNAPVPFAGVFLANTALGTSCDDQGVYSIANIPPGKYEVVVSSVGYKKTVATVEMTDSVKNVNVKLEPQVTQLREVVIDASDLKKMYKTFTEFFLGQTPNSNHCTIENPDDISLWRERNDEILAAAADKPIIVKNEALGYRVHYLLDQFELDYKNQRIKIFGIPRFENLTPTSDRQARQWMRARYDAYQGSLRHLMRSLLKRELAENLFTIMKGKQALVEDSLFQTSSGNIMTFRGDLNVVFTGETEDFQYRGVRSTNFQQSTLTFVDKKITIYENGYFEKPAGVILNGYLGWSESVANMIPLEYYFTSLKKQ
jgi:hypothetical protein